MYGGKRGGLRGWLVDRLGGGGESIYTFFACVLAMAVSGFGAYLTKQPLLFPSLGPTAFLFFESPMSAQSSPRNTLIGHAVAVLAGAASLAVFGLLHHPSVLVEGVSPARVGAGALSLALTGSVLLLLKSSHPPTGATTLIVSLGLLKTPRQMAVLMAGVVLLTVVCWIVNRAAGVPVPPWSSRE
ncbi:MAG TPA: HPP family protein [Rubrobacteraceae bacterium]|nr:HPP family protein [Rubrobacteraceae bacterium]